MGAPAYQVQEMLDRLARNRKRHPATEPEPEKPARSGCDREAKLHREIIDWCNAQWPRWKYVHARMDVRSTLDEGVCDFTIAASRGRTFYVECKTKDGKLSAAQQAWKLEMGMNDHPVHEVRSMDEFLEIVKS